MYNNIVKLHYRKRMAFQSDEYSLGGISHNSSVERKMNATPTAEVPAVLVPRLAH